MCTLCTRPIKSDIVQDKDDCQTLWVFQKYKFIDSGTHSSCRPPSSLVRSSVYMMGEYCNFVVLQSG